MSETKILTTFLTESLMIEGIYRRPNRDEITVTKFFLVEPLSIATVLTLQEVYAPGMPLRDKVGMDVRVGNSRPIAGGPHMAERLFEILYGPSVRLNAYEQHIAFEILHPFLDGNGRTGRTIWAWTMSHSGNDPFALPFLHRFYYQTLEHRSNATSK